MPSHWHLAHLNNHQSTNLDFYANLRSLRCLLYVWTRAHLKDVLGTSTKGSTFRQSANCQEHHEEHQHSVHDALREGFKIGDPIWDAANQSPLFARQSF